MANNTNSILKRIIYYLPAFLWAVLILWGSIRPGDELPSITFWQSDKVIHVLFYGILTTLASYGIKKQYTPSNKRLKLVVIAAFIGLIYGVFIEFLQGNYIQGRMFDYWDILANGIGCVLGVICAKFFIFKR